jgi:hypothetical protein
MRIFQIGKGIIANLYTICQSIIYMSEPAVMDWDRIVHKNVRSSYGQDAGNVDPIMETRS